MQAPADRAALLCAAHRYSVGGSRVRLTLQRGRPAAHRRTPSCILVPGRTAHRVPQADTVRWCREVTRSNCVRTFCRGLCLIQGRTRMTRHGRACSTCDHRMFEIYPSLHIGADGSIAATLEALSRSPSGISTRFSPQTPCDDTISICRRPLQPRANADSDLCRQP